MSSKIDVYGLTGTDREKLRQIALQRYGKASVSLLLKNLALAELQKTEPVLTADTADKKKRITLRLPENERRYLQEIADHNRSSIPETIRGILQEYIYRNPAYGHHEVTALFQSNAQLLRIGQNLNQIARKLNAGESVSLTSQHIAELKTFIEQHAGKVGDIIRQHRKRVRR